MTNASEAVQKIATDKKEYCKCSSCVIIAKIYLSIKSSEKWLVYKVTSKVAKTAVEVTQKKEQ